MNNNPQPNTQYGYPHYAHDNQNANQYQPNPVDGNQDINTFQQNLQGGNQENNYEVKTDLCNPNQQPGQFQNANQGFMAQNEQNHYNVQFANSSPNNNNFNNPGPNNIGLPDKDLCNQKDYEMDLCDESQIFSLKDTSARLQFIRKVYTILSVQLIITSVFVSFSKIFASYKNFLVFHAWLLIPAFIIYMACMYSIVYSKTCARKVPLNFILLSLLTLSMSYIVSFIAASSNVVNVLIAAVLTASITVALTVYAITTDKDLTMCGGFLFMMGMVLITASILGFFIRSKAFEIIVSCFGCVLMGFYIIYDTQLIVGGRQNELAIDDYIVGALMLYLDIIELFLQILNILEKLN